MSREEDRWIPTPEELEEGKRKRRQSEHPDREESGKQSKRPQLSLLRRLGVGRKRKYVEVDDSRTPSKTAEDRASDSTATTESRTDQPPGSLTARRVESVSLPKRRKPEPEPKYGRNSKEARFLARAAEKGHNMGEIRPIPHTTNHSAKCLECGLEAELVVQYEENYANQTYEYFRGPAIERTCDQQPS